MSNTRRVLGIIVLSQFAGTSLWFAGNAVVKDMAAELGLHANVLSGITSAVQLGFIAGTLLFAVFTVVDRFSPSKIFFVCTLIGALSNAGMLLATNLSVVLLSRFATGFFLAGIYPVGMKIASDYHEKGLGKALGYLVGALVLGTAFPHLLNGLKASYDWHYVIIGVSLLAVVGGLTVLVFLPDGPYRAKGTKPDFSLICKLFNNRNFRSAALGYFGHMWELYSFWAMVPAILNSYLTLHAPNDLNIAVASFFIIASGSIGCIAGGYLSEKKGSPFVAFTALAISFSCCFFVFFVWDMPLYIFIPFMMLWGITVVADSPQFTTLVARYVDTQQRGTALTLINCIGFSITIVSIRCMAWLQQYVSDAYLFFFLSLGPLSGLLSFRRLLNKKNAPGMER